MESRPADTSAEAWEIMTEGIRRMSPAQRVQRAVSLTVLTHSLALAQIRRRFPGEDERTHRLRLAARYIDRATMRAAFGFGDDGP